MDYVQQTEWQLAEQRPSIADLLHLTVFFVFFFHMKKNVFTLLYTSK